MIDQYTGLDMAVFALYLVVLLISGYVFNGRAKNTKDYFLGGNSMPIWTVSISVLATSQSAATFLGGPDQGYRGDFTYLTTNVAGLIAAVFVAKFLLPRFYALKAYTVYELLGTRFGDNAKYQAGLVYLFGRLFASGARLFMAAIAVAMILFGDVAPSSVAIAIVIITVVGFTYTVYGGIRTVIYSDVVQCVIYVGAAILVLGHLISAIPLSTGEMIEVLQTPAVGQSSKLTFVDFEVDFSSAGVFNIWSILTGFVLLNIAAFGLDQDVTQRMLTCKDAKSATKALVSSIVMGIPVVLVFICIGLLLFIFYQRPDVMAQAANGAPVPEFEGQTVTIFMYYVLTSLPNGIKAVVTIGIVAAALSTLNSGLNSMSSVAVQDIYRGWWHKGAQISEQNLVRAGRWSMGLVALALGSVALLCYYWQQYTDTPLLAFALSVMVFSYSGLLGIYFTALFSKRGSPKSIVTALLIGFVVPILMQPYVQSLYLPLAWQFDLAFTWQLVIGATISTLICLAGKTTAD
ncbi:sodium:solute symporter [uncultured Paraglaciecola sp.]|uniref:sodium:solute symporter n=1 Tax=uncultured Paraglaciecola sp. TaxID=1765024 RepID=UPI00261C5540|nr:sodium:solute symporter [uncultured Paraglaciecola sp.]